MSKIIKLAFIGLFMVLSLCGCSHDKMMLSDKAWSKEVKSSVNSFLKTYGNTSGQYDKSAYVVFDFDNTSSIFDVGEQLAIYQLEHMCFGFSPKQLETVLKTGLSDLKTDLSDYGYGNGSYEDWIFDIKKAYSELYATYGPFNAEGLTDEKATEMQKDPQWVEFSTKMRAMYQLIGDHESKDVSYPWLTYWYTGLTPQQVYELAKASHIYYKAYTSEWVTWTTSELLPSRVGTVSVSFTKGISVTPAMKELWRTLKENGMDVWVCSASALDVIRAAVDVFDLHEYVTGIMAMTLQTQNGKYINAYDYDTGFAVKACGNGQWIPTQYAARAQTQGKGKVTAIENVCVSQYGHGPLAGFMDSTGDFNFCTEFESLKLVVCFNRADRKITDGGGLIAELAVYQKDVLHYNLKKANRNGDTFYVLQGRDENTFRDLRSSRETLRLGQAQQALFCGEENETQLAYMKRHKMTTTEILNTFSKKTDEGSGDFPLAYGFLETYDGYHSKK